MRRLLPALLALLLSYSTSLAVEMKGLYRAQAIVTGVEEPERTRGLREGLADVAVKLTGDARLTGSAKLKPLLENPHPLVASFEYEDRMKDIPIHDEQGTRDRPHFLRMQFKPEAVDEALRKLGLPQWGPDRPLLAVWVGIETAVGRFVLTRSVGEGYGQRAVLMETAERRGIPMWLPDGVAYGVDFTDIRREDVVKLQAASPEADALLSGVLSIGETGFWRIGWRLDWKGRTRTWQLDNVSFDAALKDGLQSAALILSGNMPM